MIHLLPTGSGKTHCAERGLWVDGDTVINDATGWPPGEWWLGDMADWVTNSNYLVIRSWWLANDRNIAFWGYIPPKLFRMFPSPVVILLPTRDLLIRNHALRKEKGVSNQPIMGPNEIDKMLIDAANLAHELGVPLVEGSIVDLMLDQC